MKKKYIRITRRKGENRETLGIKYRTKWRERVTKFMGSRFINRKSFEQGVYSKARKGARENH